MRIFLGVVFMAVSVVLVLVGWHTLNNPTIPQEYVRTVNGTIVEIEAYDTVDSTNGGETTFHRVTVSFTVDGVTYGGLIDEYNITMRRGGAISLIYDARDPSVFETPGSNTAKGLILMGMGIAFLLVSGVVLILQSGLLGFLRRPDA